jgi:hypothetical protein
MRALPAIAVLVVLLLVPASAAAVILPQKGMAGVRLDMTQAQVRSVLGDPARTVRGRNIFGPYTELRYAGRLVVFFQGNREVTSISTSGRGERTARGAGVGSSEGFVRRKVGRVRCESFADAGFRSCHVGSFTPGRRVTDFIIRRGRVARVTVGYVID